jgi:two-component system, cell cycle sensor histidine kinase and response regulator CckA
VFVQRVIDGEPDLGNVHQSGGPSAWESWPGQGAVFRVYLPMAVESTGEEAAPAPEASAWRRSATVLIVEDETPLRKLISRVVAGAGYRVLEAANGQEGLILATQYGKQIDLMLSDVLMPGMSGAELMDRVRERRPDLTVVLMSGYDRELVGQRERERGVAFLPKPFTPEALLATLRAMLEEGSMPGYSASA